MEAAGIPTALQVEIDGRAIAVLDTRWPTLHKIQDIHDVVLSPDMWRYWNALVMYGGFPCQDISAGRDRWGAEGLDGDRSGLWWEFHRIAGEFQPRWLVVENVERLRNGRGGADLRAVVEGLDGLGYVGFGIQLDAAAFGLPARRPRIYLVARRAEGAHSGLEQGQRLATRFASYDPGCFVLQRTGQPRRAIDGPARPDPASYRKLTALEMERALGWPDNHTQVSYHGKPLAESHRQHLVGNGMAAPAMEAIGRFILSEERGGGA